MRRILIILTLFLRYSVLLSAYEVFCNHPNLPYNSNVTDKLILPVNYTVVTRITNFKNNETFKVIERNYTNVGTWTLHSTNGLKKWILGEYSDFSINNYTMENENCEKLQSYQNIKVYALSESIKKTFNITIDSMNEIIQKLTHYSYDTSSFLGNSRVINGVDSVTWMGCKNITNNGYKVQVLIAHSGERTQQKPYDLYFSNPVPNEISIIEYMDINKDNKSEVEIKSNVVLSIVELEKSSEKIKYDDILPPKMSFCKGFPNVTIPSNIPSDFEARYKIYNNMDNRVSNIAIFYSKKYQISSYVLEDNFDFFVPFVGKFKGKDKYKKVKIIQDFTYGYEYILSTEYETCLDVRGLSTDFVNTGILNNLIYLKEPKDFMLTPLGNNFYYYGLIRTYMNQTFASYVSNNLNNGTIEVLYLNNDWEIPEFSGQVLHTINYKSLDLNFKLELISFKNTTKESFSSINYDVSPCLEITDNSYYYIKIKNTTTKVIQNLGLQNVYDGLSYVLSNTSQITSPLRFTNHFVRESGRDVMIFFSISKKLGISPSRTIHFRNQTSIDEIITTFNKTLTLNEISFKIHNTILTICQNSLMKVPKIIPKPDPSQFVGYTAASLFVSAFFSFAFGVLLGIGGIVFQWKKHRLSNLSYQIFE
uniref:T9SS type A sorting domain-containing protein n=1 Tax=Strongyloides venezuelensis TaxID=75913 RepID=A0A0K0F8J3_STRVS